MSALKNLAKLIALLIVLLLVTAMFLPAKTHVERSVVINAKPQLIYEYVQDFKKFNQWSPWAAIDRNTQYTYSEPSFGVGAHMSWQSDHPDVGSGAQKILSVTPNQYVEVELDFGDMGIANANYVLIPLGDTTKVTWNFDDDNGYNPVARLFGVMMDGMLGPVYENGLAALKTVVEKEAAKRAAEPAIKTETVSYAIDGVPFTGYIAYPNDGQQHPGIVVVHEWWGHNDYVRGRAEQLAELGYTAFALDMYGDGKLAQHPDDANKFMQEVFAAEGAMLERFKAAYAQLKTHPASDTNNTAAIGYCFGGATVLNMARAGLDLKGVVSFHGNLATPKPAQPGDIKTKIRVFHGNADPFVPDEQVAAFKAEMDAAGADYQFVGYDGVKHSFTNPDAAIKAEKFDMPVAYDAGADADSWAQTQAFFTEIFE